MDTDTQFRDVYLALLMLMQGNTTSWNPTTRGSRDRDPQPTGEAHPDADRYRDQYAKATHELAKRRVLKDATEFLERWLGHGIARHAGETQAAIDARMVVEGQGWTVDEVARAFHCTTSRVRRACTDHSIVIDYQDRLCAAGAVTRAQIALTMSEAQVPQQQIAAALGVSQPTVSRLLATGKASKTRQAA